jgi:nicotinamide-nucleotide amidase
LKLATAESCTGGLVAGLLTSIAGSSDIFDRGFVTYSNQAKMEMLGVQPHTLERHGAVSLECAREMATGAMRNSQAHIAIAITGIAGPSGGSPEKPIGLVYFACGCLEDLVVEEKHFDALGRNDIRLAAVAFAIDLLVAQVA